jgi:CheY-like chemotaxis protein
VHVVRQVAGREIPAFLISGDTGNTARKQAQAAGLVLLDKPVRPAKLRSLLRRLGQAVETGGACTST